MDLVIFWLTILGPLAIGIAVGVWFGHHKIQSLWLGLSGVIMLLLALTLQIQHAILKSGAEVKAASQPKQQDTSRPYASVSAIGFKAKTALEAGPLTILWDIKNSQAGSQATIVEANMTIHSDTPTTPLPETPIYIPTPHRLEGFSINPGDTFNATFTAQYRALTPKDVASITNGGVKLFVFGYVRYRGRVAGPIIRRGFIALYNPRKDPQVGMFDYYEQKHYNYEIEEPR